VRVAPEGHNIAANGIDQVLDKLGSRISIVGGPRKVY
jgi:hypothetical protein